jgi:hypothetical protein
MAQMARGRTAWNKSLRKNQFYNFFSGIGEFLGNSRPMNLMIPSNLRNFFSCKSYGHLMGWSMHVDLSYDVLNLRYDVVNLGYDVINKNKRIRGRKSRQISGRIF